MRRARSVRDSKIYRIIIGILSLIVIAQWIFIAVRFKKEPGEVKIPVPEKKITGKIAIVIDDWGYNLNNLEKVKQFSYPLTLSVLPNLTYSSEIAKEFRQQGFEVILHLPMQPHEEHRGLEKNTIMSDFDESTIREIIDEDLEDIMYAKGVSNHMGSKATEDARVMEIILRELKKRNLYFLDSMVTSKSVASDLAEVIGIAFAKRDVFLDNKLDSEYIVAQIRRLKFQAQAQGYAIGIGHDRKITIEVLKQELPKLEKQGFKLVFVSELVN